MSELSEEGSRAVQQSSVLQDPRVILIAPNVSEQMGGEAIKALQIYQELDRQGVEVHQITHNRVQRELETKFPRMHVTYIKDTFIQRLFWKSRIFRPLLAMHFQWYAAKLARRMSGRDGRTVIHYTSPVSPVLPVFRTRDVPVVIGPANGNIYHPRGFRHRETLSEKFRRWGHPWAQRLQRLFFSGRQDADVLLVAGGQRTYESLMAAGCKRWQFMDSIDS